MEVWWPPIKVYFTPFINMTLRVFEAFAGVGSQRMALRNLGIDHEVVAIAEIDKFAIKSYEAIHGETNNLGDISQIDTEDIPDHDLFTYSFPCQDISVAGQGLGLDEGSGTRSGLLWECQKVIAVKKPKYLLLENVKNLVGKKHKHNFDKWLEWLEEQGYTNYWQVLNAKDYGVPQNRERVFVVSILGEHEPYIFPNKETLILRLKDVLEDEVDEKYYLNNEKAKQLIATITEENNITNPTVVDSTINEPKTKEIMNAITARYDAGIQNYKSIGGAVIEPKIKQVGNTTPNPKRENPQTGRTYGVDGLAPTLNTMQGGNRQPQIIEPKIAASRGRNPENPSDRTVGSPTEQRLEINKQGTSNTITTVQKDNYVVEPLGTLAAHNSDKFGTGYMEGVSKTLKANKHDISVVEQVRGLAETTRPNIEIGVTLRPNGDIRPHRMDKKKSGIQELNINYEDNPSHTVTSAHMPKVYGNTTNYRIRKLTPKECWRLMGFSDDDFHKAEEVNSNTQLYKQAGNSIVVDVLEGIFKQLLEVADN